MKLTWACHSTDFKQQKWNHQTQTSIHQPNRIFLQSLFSRQNEIIHSIRETAFECILLDVSLVLIAPLISCPIPTKSIKYLITFYNKRWSLIMSFISLPESRASPFNHLMFFGWARQKPFSVVDDVFLSVCFGCVYTIGKATHRFYIDHRLAFGLCVFASA